MIFDTGSYGIWRMMQVKQQKNRMLYVNLFWMAGIFVLNYFYQKNGFDFR